MEKWAIDIINIQELHERIFPYTIQWLQDDTCMGYQHIKWTL
jgi:hypothetical protein